MPLREYKPGTAFPGVIGRTIEESEPAWPQPVRAPDGVSNVVFIVLDDTGYGQLGCYGSPIRTPNIDRLAAEGLLYANMHTTALCSPTRACVITGRNHHSNGMSCITEGSTGFPGGNGLIPFENGFLSEILQQQGFNTYAIGKWHLTPAEQGSAAGPYDRWPLGRGFERYYGFLGGDTHQYYPDLVHDNHQVEPPKSVEEGYHLTVDLVDHAIAFIADSKQIAPQKPFFLYFCPGAMHAPHHVPKEWADRYKGAFDDGWDAYRQKVFDKQKELGVIPKDAVLPPRDPDVADWGSLPEDERQVYARMMEVFAGFLEHTDDQIGRLVSFLGQLGILDDTLIVLVSDNGASAEGGPHGSINENLFFNNVPETVEDAKKHLDELGGPTVFNHYPWGWTWAGNTPFRRWKRETYRGGTTDPLIVRWPKGFQAQGEVRTQYAHAIDLVPTVLEALGLEAPAAIRGVTQSPIEGVSFAHTFDDGKAASRHHTQYFEMFAHRALYHDGWRAVCPVPGPSFAEAGVGFGEMTITEEKLRELDAKGWELYHVDVDPTEHENVADQHRDKLIEMIALWYVEAGRYNVLPLDSRGVTRFMDLRPQIARPRSRYDYYPGTSTISENTAVKLLNRPYSITAWVDAPQGAEGVLFSQGSGSGGLVLFVQDGRLQYVHNLVGQRELHVDSAIPVPTGPCELRMEFQPTGKPDFAHGKGTPGHVRLFVDGTLAGEGDLDATIPLTVGIVGGLVIGRSPDSRVSVRYKAPFAFTGHLHRVEVDVSGQHMEDAEANRRQVMARQ